MHTFSRKGAIGGIAAIVLLAACTANNAGSSASSAASGAASAPASTAPSPVATVPSDQLIFAGKLVWCIDIPYPPQENFDASGNPVGSDVDIANEIAKRLGLSGQIENSVFDTIIAAVTGGKCDAIISAQNITTDRVKQVDMIPYFQAGQAFVVPKGNPKSIKAELDLCGKSVAAESGTTEADYVEGSGDYKGAGLNKKCTDGGKAAVDLHQYPKDSDALAALISGNVDAYFADSPVAGYTVSQHADQLELSGVTVEVAKEGISVPKVKTGLRDAIATALKSMMDDGTYDGILTKWGVASGGLKSSDVVPVTK